MDLFHDNPMLSGVRQMLGAFAKQYIRPVAMKHDREESMPWALMKQAQGFGMTQTAVVDGRKALTGRRSSSSNCDNADALPPSSRRFRCQAPT
jgi:hypothetical protein